MKALSIIFIILFLVTLGGLSYLYYIEHLPLKANMERLSLENSVCSEMNERLSSNVSEQAIEINRLKATIEELSLDKEAKQAKIDTLKLTYDKLVSELQREIAEGEIKITQLAGKLSVNVADKILFESGQSQISSNGLKVLKRVGDILKDTKDKKIRIEGHTDNAPIGSKLKAKYPTNWELSTARATNVVRFLQEEIGIEGQKLEAIGLAEYHPLSNNATKTGRSKNRRIEIKLIPILEE